MQQGADGEDDLVGLFVDDAVYQEPFGGQTLTGRDAIREWLRASRAQAPPDLQITVERIDIVGDVVEATWTCERPSSSPRLAVAIALRFATARSCGSNPRWSSRPPW